jgi:hypothetical protein
MFVKAVFYVQSVTDTSSGVGQVTAAPVAKGPYAEYSKYTPTGSLAFNCLNEQATKFFRDRIGKDVVLLISDPTEDDLRAVNG